MNKPRLHTGTVSQKDYGKDALADAIDKIIASHPCKTALNADSHNATSQEITINKPKEDNESPHFIEDNHRYDGKSYFANIDQFSKQACQPFPNIGGKVRFAPIKEDTK